MDRGHLLALLLVAVGLLTTTSVRADSDFWDAVRTPHLAAYRHHIAAARLALRAHRWDAAKTESEAAVHLLGDRAAGHVVHALAIGNLGQHTAAVHEIEHALELDPKCLDRPEDGSAAARAVATGGAFPLAASILHRVLGHMHDTPRREALYGLYGDMLLALGPDRLDDAILAYREALHDGSDLRAKIGLALALLRHGDRDEAMAAAHDVGIRRRVDLILTSLPLPPAEKAARVALGHEAIGDTEGARQAWQQATSTPPWDAQARAELGRLSSAHAAGHGHGHGGAHPHEAGSAP